MTPREFQRKVLEWFEEHGRHDLPWQRPATPYRVWISEVMLQQTQVATVIPYFERFMERFPDVSALADAGEDEVLHLWSGLGYYARARNLHAAARIIRDQHGGRFPTDFEAVVALPGIGRSTAGAILAQANGQRHAILDGNVKRVLCRYHAVDGWPGRTRVERRLWALAEEKTPNKRVADYTQAVMDLGATVCTRTRPACARCPVAEGCEGWRRGRPESWPESKPKKAKPVRATRMLMVHDGADVLLIRRPPAGIWGGLWSFPEVSGDEAVEDWCRRWLNAEPRGVETWRPLRHTFSHFHLDITPIRMEAVPGRTVMDDADCVWCNAGQPGRLGLAAPVAGLLDRLCNQLGR